MLSILTSIFAITINAVIYPCPFELPFALKIYPPFAFARLMYVFSFACSNGTCFRRWESITNEIYDCILVLYLGFIFFGALGTFLTQIQSKT